MQELRVRNIAAYLKDNPGLRKSRTWVDIIRAEEIHVFCQRKRILRVYQGLTELNSYRQPALGSEYYVK